MARICLVSHNAAGAFQDGVEGHIGGVERQTALLANWLAVHGHEVSVITWADYPDQPDRDLGGITHIRVCAQSEGLRIVRFVWPKWTSLISALRRANPDIVVQNVPESTTGQVGMWAKHNAVRFVYMVASELECHKNLRVFDAWQEKLLFAMGLRRADTIIAQTNVQRQALQNEWKLDSVLAPMACAPPASADRSKRRGPGGPALWVGRIDPIKRLEFLFDAASLRQDIHYDVIGGFETKSAYAQNLHDAARNLENVSLLGRKTFAEVWQHYAGASILVCTSQYEGFPNTFLEAMYFGLPIVSTFDPDGIIQSRGLGAFVESPAELVDAIVTLNSNADLYMATSEKCRTYFDEFHQAPIALSHIEQCILNNARSDDIIEELR